MDDRTGARGDELLGFFLVELDPRLVGTGVLIEVWRVEGGYVRAP